MIGSKTCCYSKIDDRKTPVLESLFNKVSGLQASNFIKNRLQHTCFPVHEKSSHFHYHCENTAQNNSFFIKNSFSFDGISSNLGK